MKYFSVLLKRTSLVVVAAAVLATMTVQPASAASAGLSITPRKNYTIEPGKEIKDKLTIGNLNPTEDLKLSLRIIDFSFMDESGSPRLMIGQNMSQTTWSLKPFMNLPTQVDVPAGSSKTVDISVKIPQGQGAGSYYSAIQYSSLGDDGGNVNLNASGVSLVFVSVPGTVNEKMTLQKIGNWQRDEGGTGGKYLKIATEKSPSIIGFTLKNEGNVFEAPVGSATLKDTFGNVVTTISEVNPNTSLALLGQSRRFEACIKPIERALDKDGEASKAVSCDKTNLKPGRYTVDLTAYYGQNGNSTHEVNGVATFWYLPLWFIIAVVAVVLLIAFVIWRIVRKLRSATGKGKQVSGFKFKRR